SGRTMPLLAVYRKDSDRAITSERPKSDKSAPRRRHYGLIVAATGGPGPVLTRTCGRSPFVTRSELIGPPLHRLVVRAAAALRGNPGDVAVGVLHVAGFAVDAVLGVDLEARAGAL